MLDLPWQGNAVRVALTCRKFFCDNRECPRRVFAEPLPTVASRYSRKTGRLLDALRELVYLAGGEAAARIARAFGLLVSPDALLDHVKQAPVVESPTPRVLGVDDFAFRRGRRYGTILVDLEQRRPVGLLPDREPQTVASWLQGHPGVEVISRDRGATYIEGASKGAPSAVQVADRWHLLKNLGDALERLLTRHHQSLRDAAVTQLPQEDGPPTPLCAPQSTPPSPWHSTDNPMTDKNHRKERRLARFEQIKCLLQEGHSQREVARRTGYSRNTIRKAAQCDALPDIAVRLRRLHKLGPYVSHLRRRWQEGTYNATGLHKEIVALGFCGNVSAVQRFVQSWRDNPGRRLNCINGINGRHAALPLALSPRQCSWLLTNLDHPRVTDEQRGFLGRLSERCPAIAAAQHLALAFCRLVRERRAGEFAAWLEQVAQSEVAELQAFARSLVQDRKAVEAGLSLVWSNGQVEGQVNRLKTLKRQMYGRASFELLRARVLPLRLAMSTATMA